MYTNAAMRKKGHYVISLFSGAMGLDLGLEREGFEIRVAVETAKTAVATIKRNKPNLPVIGSPIQEVSTEEILEKAGLSPGEATIVTGGPCCQSFSTAGNRGSLCDQRGTLYKDFCRVVHEAQPRFFVMENVRGLLSAAKKHRPLNERGPGFPPLSPEEELGSAFKEILAELTTLNYYCTYSLLNAADYGTPQVRYRVVILGSRDGEDILIPPKTHLGDGKDGEPKWVPLKEALRGVKPKEWVELPEKYLRYFKLLGPGQNWTSLPEGLQKEALGAAYYSWGGRKGFCRRLSWDKPSPSLMTTPIGKATMLCHPSKDRPLSVEEYARIQEYPPDYIIEGGTEQKYILIGNSVPLSIGQAIGKMFKNTMRKTTRGGLPGNASDRKGQVKCGDTVLEERLKRRPKTQLHPPRLRRNPDPKAAREWLSQVGGT